MNPKKAGLQSREMEESIFARAIAIDSPGERQKFITEICGDNKQLLTNLKELLREFDSPDDFFDEPQIDSAIGAQEQGHPKTIGDFEIIHEIGRGGMGVVFKAKQLSLNRNVALKMLSGGLVFSAKAINRFRREAEAAASLHHTNIVPIYDTGMQDRIPFYAMELIDGLTLDQFILQQRHIRGRSCDERPDSQADVETPTMQAESTSRIDSTGRAPDSFNFAVASKSSMSPLGIGNEYFDNIARLFSEVADALAHAHREGVVHRDIKPSNLLLSTDGRLSITDFGLAQMLAEPGMTGTGELLGSPRYMSPEQISFEWGQLDHRTDIYSLGATLYELLTFERAFNGESRDQILTQVIHCEPKSPRKIDSKIPADLETICLKAMEKAAERRYQSAADLADDLQRFVKRHAITARRVGPMGRAIRWAQRNRAIAALSSALLLFVMIGFTIIASQSIREKRAINARYEEAKREINVLVDEGLLWNVFARSHRVMQEFPDRRGEIEKSLVRIGYSIEIASDPSGAEIFVRPASNESAAWLKVGVSPATTLLPQGHYHVKLIKEGHEDLIVSRFVSKKRRQWKMLMPTRTRMVRIPKSTHIQGSDSCRISWLLSEQIPQLEEFHVDRHEVTNREFQVFVHAGGYNEERYWLDDLGPDWRETVKSFREDHNPDRLGPKKWIDGKIPHGDDDLPVVGISWYEARAYAKWARKKLPTIYHWLQASGFNGLYDQVEIVELSNIGNRFNSPRATQSDANARSVGKNGIYDLAGNVKEWCLNPERPGTYYALGGSWRDSVDSQYAPVSMDAFERREDVGFRCATYRDHEWLTKSAPIQNRKRPDQVMSFEDLRRRFGAQFQYDSTPWNLSERVQTKLGDIPVEQIEFDAVYDGDRVTCFIALPDTRVFSPPYQVVLATNFSIRRESGKPILEHPSQGYYQALTRAGRAVVMPTLFGQSSNRRSVNFPSHYPDHPGYAPSIVKMAKDISRTLDYVHHYSDFHGESLFDLDHVAFCGTGCKSPCWLLADELATGKQRFKAAILYRSGLLNCEYPIDVDPVTYLPHLKMPVLLLTCERHLQYPFETSQKPMYQLLRLSDRIKKDLISVPNQAGGVPVDQFDRHVNQWLDKWLDERRAADLVGSVEAPSRP